MNPALMTYYHRQSALLCLILYVLAAGFLVAARVTGNEPGQPVLVAVVGMLMLLLGASFHHLVILDSGDRLTVRFGPLPLFQKRIQYDDIREVELGRTTLIEGWGIHMSPRGGWVWNLWGRDCVVVHLQQDIIRIGTDDAENLARFLESRISSPA
jgi:hypothetical protein